MTTSPSAPAQAQKSAWAMLGYFILGFYHFGTVMMTYCIDYAGLDKGQGKNPQFCGS